MRIAFAAAVLCLGCTHVPSGATPAPIGRAALPSYSEQIRLREAWLGERHGLLLNMMRRNGIAMWVVVNEEFHDDPLTALVAPPRPYAGNRDFFIFVDAGAEGLKRHAVTGFYEEALSRFFEIPQDPKPAKEALQALWQRYQPRTIGLSIDGRRGVTRSLTRSTYDFLVEALGSEARARFVPAEALIEEYCDTRLAAEMPVYRQMVAVTADLA
jgi:Xaa-Pro dipeptidase